MKANVNAIKLCAILSGVILTILILITIFSDEYSGVALGYNIAMGLLTSAFITGSVTYLMYLQQKNDYLINMYNELLLSAQALYYFHHILIHINNDIANPLLVQDEDVIALSDQISDILSTGRIDVTKYKELIRKTKIDILKNKYDEFFKGRLSLADAAVSFSTKISLKKASAAEAEDLLYLTKGVILMNEDLISQLSTSYLTDRNYEESIKLAKDTALSRCPNCTLQQTTVN